MNMSNKLVRGTYIILRPFQDHMVILQDEHVAMNDLVGERVVRKQDFAICSSCLEKKIGLSGTVRMWNSMVYTGI